MKRANVLALANFLEARGRKFFDMNNWFPGTDCGTPACIGGSACLLWPDINERRQANAGRFDTDLRLFARKLGISYSQARTLCYPSVWSNGSNLLYPTVTLKNAVRTLRRLANTGKIEFRWGERR